MTLGIGVAAAIVVMFAVAPLSAALTTHAANGDPSVTCGVNSDSVSISLAGGQKADKIVSVTWTTINDEDSGLAAYWAMDTYTNTLTVWYLGAGPYAGSFFYIQTIKGNFITPVGAVSPETGVGEVSSGYGTLTGLAYGYIAPTEEFINPGALSTTGSLGTVNYGGTMSDILLDSYSAPQVGDLGTFYVSGTGTTYTFGALPTYAASTWWYFEYFYPAVASDFGTTNFGFNYVLNSAFTGTGSMNNWCDFSVGDYGDIVTV